MSDYGLSRKQLRRLRHASISQTTQIFHGVQGEASRRMQDHVLTGGRIRVPAHRWVRDGFWPPQWSTKRPGRFHGDPDTCPGCGKDYERRWHGSDGTVAYDHGGYCETGPICRMEADDENE